MDNEEEVKIKDEGLEKLDELFARGEIPKEKYESLKTAAEMYLETETKEEEDIISEEIGVQVSPEIYDQYMLIVEELKRARREQKLREETVEEEAKREQERIDKEVVIAEGEKAEAKYAIEQEIAELDLKLSKLQKDKLVADAEAAIREAKAKGGPVGRGLIKSIVNALAYGHIAGKIKPGQRTLVERALGAGERTLETSLRRGLPLARRVIAGRAVPRPEVRGVSPIYRQPLVISVPARQILETGFERVPMARPREMPTPGVARVREPYTTGLQENILERVVGTPKAVAKPALEKQLIVKAPKAVRKPAYVEVSRVGIMAPDMSLINPKTGKDGKWVEVSDSRVVSSKKGMMVVGVSTESGKRVALKYPHYLGTDLEAIAEWSHRQATKNGEVV